MAFKSIPGNDEYEISLIGSIRRKDGELCDLPSEGVISIIMFNTMVDVDIQWLTVVSQYELTTKEMIDEVEIGPIVNKLSTNSIGWWIRFKKPIYHLDIYRVIASNPTYAISKDGVIIRVRDGFIVTSNVYGTIPYPCCTIYTPSLNKSSSNRVHRLVALAWCDNDDPTTKIIVDHLDGDKCNFAYSNLEWVTNQENMIRALSLGSSQSIECRIRQHSTGKIKSFPSIAAGIKYFNLPPSKCHHIFTQSRPGWITDDYEVKLIDDDSEWRYSGTNSSSRYEVTINWTNDDVFTLYGIRELYKEVNKYYKQPIPTSIAGLTELMSKVVNVKSIEVKDYYSSTNCEAKCESTGVVYSADSFIEMARLLDLHPSNVRNHIIKGDSYIHSGYRFRLKSNSNWSIDIPTKRNFRIKITRIDSGLVTIHDSIRQGAIESKISRRSLATSLQDDRPVAGVLVQQLI